MGNPQRSLRELSEDEKAVFASFKDKLPNLVTPQCEKSLGKENFLSSSLSLLSVSLRLTSRASGGLILYTICHKVLGSFLMVTEEC